MAMHATIENSRGSLYPTLSVDLLSSFGMVHNAENTFGIAGR